MNPQGQHHPDGAFDDPLHEWWQKNGKSLIAGALIIVIGTGLIFGFRAYRASQEDALQVAFNDAVATDTLAEFAEANAGYPLAGIAALQTANFAFGEQDWNRALEFYSLAAESLAGNPLSGKARLGVAITQSKMGESTKAKNILATLADDTTEFPAARAEALYFLSLLALEEGQQDEFEKWSGKLADLDQTGNWSSRLSYFESRVPIPVGKPPAISTPLNDAAEGASALPEVPQSVPDAAAVEAPPAPDVEESSSPPPAAETTDEATE